MSEDFYRTPQAELIDPLAKASSELAARGTRLAATIIDQMIGLVVLAPILVALIRSDFATDLDALAMGPWGAATFALGLALIVVTCVLMARTGQTIGKRWLGIRVVRSDGSPLSFGRWLGLRVLPVNLLAQVPLVGIAVALADPLLIFRANNKCLHDEIADTIVVKVS